MKRVKGFKRQSVKRMVATQVAMRMNPIEPTTGMSLDDVMAYLKKNPALRKKFNAAMSPK